MSSFIFGSAGEKVDQGNEAQELDRSLNQKPYRARLFSGSTLKPTKTSDNGKFLYSNAWMIVLHTGATIIFLCILKKILKHILFFRWFSLLFFDSFWPLFMWSWLQHQLTGFGYECDWLYRGNGLMAAGVLRCWKACWCSGCAAWTETRPCRSQACGSSSGGHPYTSPVIGDIRHKSSP